MKIRQGFVSNSSSSSFLVGFKKKPKTRKELRDIMFGDFKGDIVVCDYAMDINDIVRRVFSDLKEQRPLTEKQFIEEFNYGFFPGYPKPNFNKSSQLEKDFIALFNKTLKPGQNPISSFYSNEAQVHPGYKMYRSLMSEVHRIELEIEKSKIHDSAVNYYHQIKHLFEGVEVYKFEYADDAGENVLEHGDIFSNLPCVIVSHH